MYDYSIDRISSVDGDVDHGESGALFLMVALLIVFLLVAIAKWKIFKKAGEAGWKSLIPIYGSVILLKIAGISPWFVLIHLIGNIIGYIPNIISYIPNIIGYIPNIIIFYCTIVSAIASRVYVTYVYYRLAKSFGNGTAFSIGAALLPDVFLFILAFDKSQYIGVKYGSNNMYNSPNPGNPNFNPQNPNYNTQNPNVNNVNSNYNAQNPNVNNVNSNYNAQNPNVNNVNSNYNVQNPNVNNVNSNYNVQNPNVNNVNSNYNAQNPNGNNVNSSYNTQNSNVNNVFENRK